MENHNFMINYVVNNFIHFCGNINDRVFDDFFALKKIAGKKSDKCTEYIQILTDKFAYLFFSNKNWHIINIYMHLTFA